MQIQLYIGYNLNYKVSIFICMQIVYVVVVFFIFYFIYINVVLRQKDVECIWENVSSFYYFIIEEL